VSLIVGLAGSSFFAAMQDKVRAALGEQRAELVHQTLQSAVMPRVRDQEIPNHELLGAAEAVGKLSGHALAQARQERLRTQAGARKLTLRERWDRPTSRTCLGFV